MKRLLQHPCWILGTALIGNLISSSVSASSMPLKVAPRTAAQDRLLAWLPPASETQGRVFEYVAAKLDDLNGEKAAANRQPYDPQPVPVAEYPKTNTIPWALARYRTAPNDPAAYYTLVYQDLKMAQRLLGTGDLTRQREGMRLASIAQLCAFDTLSDKRLYARIFEGFLLPYLPSAYAEKWQDLSRQQIVEGAYGAFAGSGEIDKQIALLRFYLTLTSHQAADQNDADWARDQLAQALAGQGKYAEAIQALQSIQAANFAIKQLIPVYQKQLDAQKPLAKQGQRPNKPTAARKPLARKHSARTGGSGAKK